MINTSSNANTYFHIIQIKFLPIRFLVYVEMPMFKDPPKEMGERMAMFWNRKKRFITVISRLEDYYAFTMTHYYADNTKGIACC